jgi:membrane protein DedA with SNARE-associated domain
MSNYSRGSVVCWWYMTALPGFLQTAAPFLDSYGYVGVASLLVLEDFGLPVPGETILIAAAIYAGTGRLNVVVLLLVAIIAAIIGDNIGFAIGHYGGDRLVRRYGRYVLLSPEKLEHAKEFFNRHGGWVVVIARFVEGLRQLNGIIAGTAEMRWRRFLVYNVVGASLWASAWVTAGYLAGNNIGPIYKIVQRYQWYALAVAVLVVVGLVVRVILKRQAHASIRRKR